MYKDGLGKAVTGEKVAGLSQTAEEAYAIRAATIAACERVVELEKQVAEETGKTWLTSMSAMDLDGYLWSVAKVGELRNLPRLSERGTMFY